MKPTVLYIIGYGRSGSTILDMLLGMHPNIIGVGELADIFHHWLADEPCSCGLKIHGCWFWKEVMAHYNRLEPDISIVEAAAVTREIEQGLNQLRVKKDHRLTRTYGRVWQALFTAIAAVAEVAFVVDSSKSARDVSGRALALSRFADLDIRLIHMVRDPRAVMYSYLRGNNVRLEQGEAEVKKGGAPRMLTGWMISNAAAHWTIRSEQLPVCRLRYEDLATNPIKEIVRLADALEIDLQDLQDFLQSESQIQPDHGIRGNRLRRTGVQHIYLDEEWKERLPTRLKALAALSWPLSLLYKYW